MRDFFKGWRRKVGCVTLMMACVLSAAWIRNQSIVDYLEYGYRNCLWEIQSNTGWVSISRRTYEREITRLGFRASTYPSKPAYGKSFRFGWFSEDFGWGHTNVCSLPCWSIVLPLTLLSAFLLLGKPRVAKPKKAVEPDRA